MNILTDPAIPETIITLPAKPSLLVSYEISAEWPKKPPHITADAVFYHAPRGVVSLHYAWQSRPEQKHIFLEFALWLNSIYRLKSGENQVFPLIFLANPHVQQGKWLCRGLPPEHFPAAHTMLKRSYFADCQQLMDASAANRGLYCRLLKKLNRCTSSQLDPRMRVSLQLNCTLEALQSGVEVQRKPRSLPAQPLPSNVIFATFGQRASSVSA